MSEVDQYRRILEVQERDTRIQELREEIDGLPEKYHLDGHLEDLRRSREELKGVGDEIEEINKVQHKLEGELQILNEKLEREEGKLFSGTIMNPKELADIQQEVVSLKGKRDVQETEFLERMEEIENMQARVREAEKKERRALDEERVAREKHDGERGAIETQIRELEKERDKLKQDIDPELVRLYEELLEEKGGLAAVPIEKNICGGCHMEISSVDMDHIRHSNELFRCRYCRRIMIKRALETKSGGD